MIWGRNKLSFWGANKGLLSKPRAPGALECQRHGGGEQKNHDYGKERDLQKDRHILVTSSASSEHLAQA